MRIAFLTAPEGVEQVKVCDHGTDELVTSRKPDDLKAFRATCLDVFEEEAVGR